MFYLNNNQFSLQWLSIWEFLPKAQIDGVLRRAPSVLFEVHEICNNDGGLRHMHDTTDSHVLLYSLYSL